MKALVILCLLSVPAWADVIRRPTNCPEGHKPAADHNGSYCVPPAPKCKKGETARQVRERWYCEPPPPKAGCPAGSSWHSTSPTDTWCDGQRDECEGASGASDPACVETSLCVTEIARERRGGRSTARWTEERVTSVCPADGSACPAPTKCVKARRYVPVEKKPSAPPTKGLLLLLLAASVGAGLACRRRA